MTSPNDDGTKPPSPDAEIVKITSDAIAKVHSLQKARDKQEALKRHEDNRNRVGKRDRVGWEKMLTNNPDGTVATRPENIERVLMYHQDWAGVFAYDEFSDREVIVKKPLWEMELEDSIRDEAYRHGKPVTDGDVNRIISWLSRSEYSIMAGPDSVMRALSIVSRKKMLHPVREYLQSISWDGTPRLNDLLTDYFGAVKTDYTSKTGRYWMVSAVARVMEPGCKVDHVMILEGPQGINKSSGLRVLASPKWFLDTEIDLQSKDAYQVLNGKWIVEFAELNALRRADETRAKAFFTGTVDTYRPPYGRYVISIPRQCIFAGTVNPDGGGYIKDKTGGRRYWPVVCGSIDLNKLSTDRDQLWAEAYYLYTAHDACSDDGERHKHPDFCTRDRRCERHRWWPDGQRLVEVFSDQQAARIAEEPTEPIILEWLEKPTQKLATEFTTHDVVVGALAMSKDKIRPGDMVVAGRCLLSLGFERKQKRVGGTRLWYYVRK